jgi:hypothetical protein
MNTIKLTDKEISILHEAQMAADLAKMQHDVILRTITQLAIERWDGPIPEGWQFDPNSYTLTAVPPSTNPASEAV